MTGFGAYGMGDYELGDFQLGSFEAEPGLGGFVPETANPRDQQVADKMKAKAGVYGDYDGDYEFSDFGTAADDDWDAAFAGNFCTVCGNEAPAGQKLCDRCKTNPKAAIRESAQAQMEMYRDAGATQEELDSAQISRDWAKNQMDFALSQRSKLPLYIGLGVGAVVLVVVVVLLTRKGE